MVKEAEVKEAEVVSESITLVAPIESVKSVKEAKEVKEAGELNLNPCWNCGQALNSEDKCVDCGFDKGLLYNLDLEAEIARKKQLAKLAIEPIK
jgi:hypothetical protein